MAVIFSNAYGSVTQLSLPGALAITTGIGVDPVISFEDRKSIITSISLSERTNIQISPSLGKAIHIYVFGDRPGQATVSGISFYDPCTFSGFFGIGDTVNDIYNALTPHGFSYMRQYYKQNKASSRAEPVSIITGRVGESIRGFITGFQGNIVNPETRVFEWGMSLTTLPE